MTTSTNGGSPLRRRGEEKKEKEDSFLEDRMNQNSTQNTDHPQRETSSSYSSSNQEEAVLREQKSVARLLKSCGVRFYAPLAKSYPPDFVRAKVGEWKGERADGTDLGPGMLVKMIQGGSPIVGDVAPVEPPAAEADPSTENLAFLRRRAELHEKGQRPMPDDYEYDEQGRLQRSW